MIYADNAATTKLDEDAFEAMKPWLCEEYGNASQPYAFSRAPKKALLTARETIAGCIHALPEEIYFTSGGTESDNWAIKGLPFCGPAPQTKKKAIVTSAFEHHAVLHACQTMERQGFPVSYLSPTRDGYVAKNTLSRALTDSVGLVSVMSANNEIGTIQPVADLCALAHRAGAVFHTDAVQAVGHVPVNVKDLSVDLLSASAHKFHGPKGVGFLYVRKGISLFPYMDGGAQESGLRAGTENIAGIVGMAAALKKCCDSLPEKIRYVKGLENLLLEELCASGIPFHRNGGEDHLPGLISLSFPGADGEAILHRLDLKGICVSTGSACNSRQTEISHVLKAIGLEDDYAQGTIRISLGDTNSREDVREICRALAQILS